MHKQDTITVFIEQDLAFLNHLDPLGVNIVCSVIGARASRGTANSMEVDLILRRDDFTEGKVGELGRRDRGIIKIITG